MPDERSETGPVKHGHHTATGYVNGFGTIRIELLAQPEDRNQQTSPSHILNNSQCTRSAVLLSQASRIVKQRKDEELEKARRLVQAAETKERNAITRAFQEAAKEARK